MSAAIEQRLMTVEEVAAQIRVSVPTVYRWAQSGRIPSIRVGNAVRIPRRWLDRIIAEAEREANAEGTEKPA